MEANQLIKNCYISKKIIHVIIKKYIINSEEFLNIPDKIPEFNSVILELKFICFADQVWKSLQNSFSKNYLNIDNLYCSSYVRSSSYNSLFKDL